MNRKLILVFVGICLVLSIYSVLDFRANFSGLAIYNEEAPEEILLNAEPVSEGDAINAIGEARRLIEEMSGAGFSTIYVEDKLSEAENVFQQIEYAKILKGEVEVSRSEKLEAEKALSLVNWKILSYEDVLAHTDEIKERRDKAFLLEDMISVEKTKIDVEQENLDGVLGSPSEISEETMKILDDAKVAFDEERYDESQNLIEEFRNSLEEELAERTRLSGIQRSAQNFFARYWMQVIFVLILVSVGIYFIYKKFEKRLVKKKIIKMQAEEKSLATLMKKTQEERFKKNSISGLVYNIRMKKYEERLMEIKEELPVLEKVLVRLGKK